MEKRRPSHDLAAIKRVLGSVERLAITGAALRDAQALGFTRHGVALTIRLVDRAMFVKSMTTYADHREWQDVCRVPVEGLVPYVKFQADAVTEFRLVSFKER
jgi:motility quorum-sensing regulator / GCU-specific mRNA interferase toxin